MVGLARLGRKVGFIGKVGGDREGDLLLEDSATKASTWRAWSARSSAKAAKSWVRGRTGTTGTLYPLRVNDSIALEEVERKVRFPSAISAFNLFCE